MENTNTSTTLNGHIESIDWETRELTFVTADKRIVFSGITMTGDSRFTEPSTTATENTFVCEHFEDLYAEENSCSAVLHKWSDKVDEANND